MNTHSFSQHRTNPESADRVVANLQPRGWGEPNFDQPQQAQQPHHNFSHVDLFAHAPQRSPIQTQLTDRQPNDVHEQEVDRAIEHVTTQAPPDNPQQPNSNTLQLKPTTTSSQSSPNFSHLDLFTHAPQRRPVQLKLRVGAPNDVYEQEADRVAEQVISMAPPATPNLQRQTDEEEIQTKPLVETITPFVQRQESEEEEPIQAKCEACETEKVQRSSDTATQAQPDLETQLNASKGSGSTLPDEVRSFMEPRFGTDFGGVRVHTGSKAIQMNRDLNAQAFTHQQDIYFGSGKSPGNDALTAHELTHVLQQRGAIKPVSHDTSESSETSDAGLLQHQVSPKQSNPSLAIVSVSKTDLIQRNVDDLITTPMVLDDTSILTYEELATWYGWRRIRLMEQQDELNREGLAVPDSVTQAITRAQEMITLNVGGGTEPITEGIVLDARTWLRAYIGAMNAAEAAKGSEAARRLRSAEESSRVAQTNLEETVIPQLRERQRSSFRSEDDSELLQVADTIGTALDTLMNLKEVMLEIRREAAVLENMRNFAAGHTGLIPSANSYAPIVVGILDRLNQIYAGVQLLMAGFDIIAGGHRTDSAAARSGVSALATTYSAGGTLLGASAGVSMYANFYVAPMTSACLDALARLEDTISRTTNRDWIGIGEYGSVNWSIEPGGRPMFDFMLQAMQARSSSDIPTPVPSAVESYLMDHRDSFDSGIGSHRGAMPTTGWIFKDLDQAQVASWVFINRSNLWGMLYGAATPPT